MKAQKCKYFNDFLMFLFEAINVKTTFNPIYADMALLKRVTLTVRHFKNHKPLRFVNIL